MILLICMMLHAESRGSGGLPSPTYAWPEPAARRYASILDVPQPTPHRNRQSRPTRNADRRRSASKLTGCERQAGGGRYASESALLCMPEHAQHDILPCNQRPTPVGLHHHVCRDIRSTPNTPQPAPRTNQSASSRMPRHTQHNRYPTDNDLHRSTCTITRVRTYTARQIPHSQQPPADITTTCACRDIRNRPQPQEAAVPTPASTPAPAPPPHRRERTSAIDHFDRDIRRRITARVWRAAAPRRPRSSSTQAD